MAGTVIADRLEAASTSQLVIENGVALTPPTIVDVNNVQIGTFCRAWVNFNGTGTVAINASFNVSSITDNGTGNYTVNFTNAMPDANYAANGSATFLGSGWYDWVVSITFNTSSFQFQVNSPTTLHDSATVSIAIFR